MIPLNQEQHLGRKAYMLMVSRKMTVGFVIFIISLLLIPGKNLLAGLIAGAMSVGGASTKYAVAMSSNVTAGVIVAAFIVALFAMLVGVSAARLEYGRTTFTFEEFGMKLRKGVLSVIETSIPYRQMQDVTIERSLIHQFMGTSRIVIESAGEETPGEPIDESEIILDPVDKDTAEEIRAMLGRKIGVQVVKGEAEADREAASQTSTDSGVDA